MSGKYEDERVIVLACKLQILVAQFWLFRYYGYVESVSLEVCLKFEVHLPFFLIYLQFIEWLMYGEVTSRNHHAYS